MSTPRTRCRAVHYALAPTPLGQVLGAADDRGLRAVLLGDDPAALLGELRARFPRATLAPADAALERLMARLVGLMESPGAGLDLPLAFEGTPFQQRVWQTVRAIPAGTTASYGDIADRMGAPTAARAVAQACAANPLAVVVPCHRVVRGDGEMGGYRWGLDRKRALLAREAAA